MKIYYFSILFLLSVLCAKANIFQGDTTFNPSIRYTKSELKKEMNDVKTLDKHLKEWENAIKQKNTDYLNSVFSNTMKLLEKEQSELSNRVSARSKEMFPSNTPNKTSSTGEEDKPKVYNSELKDQIVHVNKQDIMRRKAESDYLNKYITVIRYEKTIIAKLKNVKTFDVQTSPSVYQQISSDLKEFKKEMNEEIALMKKETGKK